MEDAIASWVELAVSPRASPDMRANAFTQIEAFKRSPNALQVCFSLFYRESSSSSRMANDAVLHFCLRTISELCRERWSGFSGQEQAELKKTWMVIASNPPTAALSRVVQQALVSLGAQIVKCDTQSWDLFNAMMDELGAPASPMALLAARVMVSLSEDVTDEDRTLEGTSRRSELAKHFGTVCSRILGFALNGLAAVMAQPSPVHDLLILYLQLAKECLRWALPAARDQERCLGVLGELTATANAQLPERVAIAAYDGLLALVEHRPESLEKSGVSLLRVYETVRACVVTRDGNKGFRSEHERSEACHVFIALVETHFPDLCQVLRSREQIVTDLKAISIACHGKVFSDTISAWKLILLADTGKTMLDASVIDMLVEACAFVERDEESPAEDDEERTMLLYELVRRRALDACVSCERHLERALQRPNTPAWHEAWLLAEGCVTGLSAQDMQAFAAAVPPSKEAEHPLVLCLHRVMQVVFASSSSLPCTVDKLKLLNATHRLFECEPRGRTLYLAEVLNLIVGRSMEVESAPVVKKRAAQFLLVILRRLVNANDGEEFRRILAGNILPALITRVQQSFHLLTGPERFALLESILVAGKALPVPEARFQLTRDILSDSFRVLSALGLGVLSNLIAVKEPSATTASSSSSSSSNNNNFGMEPWDSRGFLADIAHLPDNSRNVAVAFMTLSTCSRDGSMTPAMWNELVPIALQFLRALHVLWSTAFVGGAGAPIAHTTTQAQRNSSSAPTSGHWAKTIHPVDSRILLGGRLAETQEMFMEGLVRFGETVLKPERMSVISFLSSARTCATELINGAQKDNRMLREDEVLQLLEHVEYIEHRHLALLLDQVVVVSDTLFDKLAHHVVTDRLRAPRANPQWEAQVHPDCPAEYVDTIHEASVHALERELTRALVKRTPNPARMEMIGERLLTGDETTVRLACQALNAEYLPLNWLASQQQLVRVCAQALRPVRAYPLVEASRRAIVELFGEGICFLLYRVGSKDCVSLKNKRKIQVSLPGLGSMSSSSSTSTSTPSYGVLIEMFGSSAFSQLMEGLLRCTSDKKFQRTVCGFVHDQFPPGVPEVVVVNGVPTTTTNVIHHPATDFAVKKSRRKKKATKAGESVEMTGGDQQQQQPPRAGIADHLHDGDLSALFL